MTHGSARGQKTEQNGTLARRGPRKPKPQPWIMHREEAAIIKSLPNTGCPTGQRNRAMIELMHRAGLRCAEVCGLLTRDVHGLDEAQGVRPSLRVVGKGGKERTVSLDAQTIHWMRRWYDTRQGRRLTGRTFFVTLRGTLVSTRYVRQLVRRLAGRAARRGLIDPERATKISPHKFRHAFGSEMAEEGIDLVKIKEQLGHENLATTSIYLHARDGALAEDLAARAPDLPLDQG